ncbi:MAG: PRC-barrel domain-containing protein [Bacillota bacterium]
MPRSSDLIGLPVLAGPRLKRIGRVQEVLISRDGSRLCGLVLESGGILHPRRVLDFSAIRALGATHLLAEEIYLDDERGTCCGESLHGLPVLDGAGEELGMMDDIHFEPTTGRILALQLSRGFVDDLLSGKGVVPISGPVTTGEAAILLGPAGDLDGGLQG